MEYQSLLERQERCMNCNHLYFKNLKVFNEQFCSIDCKTNYNYIQLEIIPYINKIDEASSIPFSESSLYDLNNTLPRNKQIKKIQSKSINYIYKKHNYINIYTSL